MAVKNKVLQKAMPTPAGSKARRRGRPRLFDEKMTAMIPVRMTSEQKLEIETRAALTKGSVNDWCREKLLAAAREPLPTDD
jgi:hypothetical protein